MTAIELRSDNAVGVHLEIMEAIARLCCSPAELTWQVGVDVLSLRATNNGALSPEAIVVFDARAADDLVYRIKRSDHVNSELRFQSPQPIAVPQGRAVLAARRPRESAD